MALRDKSYTTSCPDLPPTEENGWSGHQKEHTFPLCAYLSMHLNGLLSLLNAARSKTAMDTVAVIRTDSPCFGDNFTNPFKDDTRVEDEEADDDALSA